jgi:hypothetical protein
MIFQAIDTEQQDMAVAKEVGEILNAAYPGHAWAVTIAGGTIQIKNLLVSSMWCMVIHYENVMHDAKVRKEKVIRAGGEFLERCHMRRGLWNGEYAKTFEGAAKWKPLR